MKILHGRAVLAPTGLDEQDQTVYGFDTTQVTYNPESDTAASITSHIHDDVDYHFNVSPFNFYLALQIENGGMATNASGLYNNQDYLNRNDGSTGSAWYGKIKNTVTAIHNNTTGTAGWASWVYRFKGIRWNHEYRVTAWDRGSSWWDWADGNTGGLDDEVKTFYLTEWNNALGSIAAGPDYLTAYEFANNLGKATQPPFNSAAYDKPKELFGSYFVDYMCDREATIIGHIADVLSEVSASLKLILYPPTTIVNNSPTIRPPYEYTLDANRVDKSNIVWESSGYDYTHNWINEAASSAGTHDFFITMQQPRATTLPSPLADVGSWVRWRLDATNAAGASPWNSSFGFWTDWPNPRFLSDADQGSYMDEIKDELT